MLKIVVISVTDLPVSQKAPTKTLLEPLKMYLKEPQN